MKGSGGRRGSGSDGGGSGKVGRDAIAMEVIRMR